MNEQALAEAYLAAVERHKTHPPRLRRDPDGVHRCPACDPVPAWRRVLGWVRRRR